MGRVRCYGAPMGATPVELRVGGQTYRVVASAEEAELRRLADMVDARLRDLVAPGRQLHPQALLLAAIALAHDLEQERERRQQVEQRSREMLSTVLARIDAVLESTDTPSPPAHRAYEEAPPAEPT